MQYVAAYNQMSEKPFTFRMKSIYEKKNAWSPEIQIGISININPIIIEVRY